MDPKIASLAPVPLENLYHVAFLVRDVEESMEHVGDVFGATWGRPRTDPVVGRDGRPWPVTFAFSLQGPPYIELLQGFDEPGSPTPLGFDQSPPGVHHYGVFAAKWRDELERLEGLGMTIEFAGAGYGFVRSPLGFRLEVVSWKGRGFLVSYLAGNGVVLD